MVQDCSPWSGRNHLNDRWCNSSFDFDIRILRIQSRGCSSWSVNHHIVWKLHDNAHRILAIRNYIRELSITFIVHQAYQNTRLKARPAPA